jgi:hypothetical protein
MIALCLAALLLAGCAPGAMSGGTMSGTAGDTGPVDDRSDRGGGGEGGGGGGGSM